MGPLGLGILELGSGTCVKCMWGVLYCPASLADAAAPSGVICSPPRTYPPACAAANAAAGAGRRGGAAGGQGAARAAAAAAVGVGQAGGRLLRCACMWARVGAEPGACRDARRALQHCHSVVPRPAAGAACLPLPATDSESSSGEGESSSSESEDDDSMSGSREHGQQPAAAALAAGPAPAAAAAAGAGGPPARSSPQRLPVSPGDTPALALLAA